MYSLSIIFNILLLNLLVLIVATLRSCTSSLVDVLTRYRML